MTRSHFFYGLLLPGHSTVCMVLQSVRGSPVSARNARSQARCGRMQAKVVAQAAATGTAKKSVPTELEEGELPLNTFSPKKPFKAKIKSVEKITGPKATGETYHIIIDTKGDIPFWEGQSYGVIPPVSDLFKPTARLRSGPGRRFTRIKREVSLRRVRRQTLEERRCLTVPDCIPSLPLDTATSSTDRQLLFVCEEQLSGTQKRTQMTPRRRASARTSWLTPSPEMRSA